MDIEGRRGRGRPQKKWGNTIGEDMRAAGVCVEDVRDWAKWMFRTKVVDHK